MRRDSVIELTGENELDAYLPTCVPIFWHTALFLTGQSIVFIQKYTW